MIDLTLDDYDTGGCSVRVDVDKFVELCQMEMPPYDGDAGDETP